MGSLSLPAQTDPEYPSNDPAMQQYSDIAATLLAEEIRHVYGGEEWTDSLYLEFDFVAYTRDGRELVRYHNEWNRLTDEASLSGTMSGGRFYEVRFTELSSLSGTMTIDSQAIPEAHLQSGLVSGYERLTSNIRWLITPLMLLDTTGVLLMMNDSNIDGQQITPLYISYSDTISSASGATLYVNSKHKTIDRWKINYEGEDREYIWRQTRRVGPFLFATKMWADDFQTYIMLEGIKVKRVTGEGLAEVWTGK